MCSVLALASTARADPLVPAYLYDEGSWLFVWGALAAREAVDRYVDPPERPVGFASDEGGAAPASWEMPGYAVTASAGIVAAALLASDDAGRWQHAKGLAQTLSTGALLTLSLKVGFGRRRPDQGPVPGEFGGESRSFPSGHATQAFEIATYTALYLHTHSFARERRWWHGAVHAGLYGAACLVAAERVWHRRHHVSDVVAGAALGSAVAAAFFFAHERRLSGATSRRRLWLTPGPQEALLGVGVAWRR